MEGSCDTTLVYQAGGIDYPESNVSEQSVEWMVACAVLRRHLSESTTIIEAAFESAV